MLNNIIFPAYRRFQDPPFFISAMINAGEFYAIPDIVYIYRKRENNVIWTVTKAIDMMQGIVDNLETAKKYRYEILYNLTLSRIIDTIPKFMSLNDIVIIKKMLEIYDKLDISDKVNDINQKFIELLYSQIFEPRVIYKKEIDNLLSSRTYRLGYFLTWLPNRLNKIFRRK